MNVEYTGRQYEITPAIRKEVETGLAKIRKILGDKFEAKVILAVEKHRHKAEITISPRNGPIVGLAQSTDMKLAVNEALDHIEKQAVKYKTRIISKKRKSHKKWNGEAKIEASEKQTSVGLTETTAVPVVVHKYPAVAKTTEVHLTHSVRSRGHAPHDARRSHQGMPLSRPRRLCLPRSQGQGDGAASDKGWEDGVDRSAIKTVVGR